jgi:hypothetical protein
MITIRRGKSDPGSRKNLFKMLGGNKFYFVPINCAVNSNNHTVLSRLSNSERHTYYIKRAATKQY